jgi:hypothetical protein
MMEKRRSRYRSLFWPVILIGVGVFLLLGNLGVLPEHSLWTLVRLWPLILIIIGLDILIGRRSPLIGALIGIGAVALAVVLVFGAPELGIVPTGETLVTERFTETNGDATSAEINLNLSIGKTTISALTDSTDLFAAELTHFGQIDFDVQDGNHKTISLSQGPLRYDFEDLHWFDTENLQWEIGLSPVIPLSLNIDASIGQSVIDLNGLQIDEVDIHGDVGETTVTLPATVKTYNAKIEGGFGKFVVNLAADASLNLTIDGDVGEFTINIPSDANVRIDAEVDIGDLHIDSRFDKISGGESDFLSDRGVWETPGFASADKKITIVFNGGIGSLHVK